MYLSWATFFEGGTDDQYFNVIIPKILEEILRTRGRRPYDVALAPSVEFSRYSREFEVAAQKICEREQEFHILFLHADTGGRALENQIHNRRESLVRLCTELCQLNERRFVFLSPKKELEAWALSDPKAIATALGVRQLVDERLPASAVQAERLDDPKALLHALVSAQTRRGSPQILVRIAQEHDLAVLRRLPSFKAFEESLCNALTDMGCLE